MTKRLIIGLGTGRCGTKSLSVLLNHQCDTFLFHEMSPRLSWHAEAKLVLWRMRWLTILPHNCVGDVAYWYLPHVQCIAAAGFDARFVVLRRERESCIESMLAKYAVHAINPLQKHDGGACRSDLNYLPALEASLPKYDSLMSLGAAAGRFYDDYYAECDAIQKQLPNCMVTYPMESLNTEDGVRSISDFCGYENQRVVTGIRLNAANMLSKRED